jgi:hypothetical protein
MVQMQAGDKDVIELLGAASGQGTLDARLAPLSIESQMGSGWILAETPVTGERRMVFTPNVDGNYLIAVDGGANTGTYKLAVRDVSGDQVAPTLATGPAPVLKTISNLQLGFSEEVLVDASAITIRDSSGEHLIPASFIKAHAYQGVVTIDPVPFFLPGRTYTVSLAPGAVRDLAGNAYASETSLTFTTPAASLQPGNGDDQLALPGKGETVDGGAGIDTALFPGWSGDFNVFRLENGQVRVQSRYSDGPAALLDNVERVHFYDKAIALDADGNFGQIYRLYTAAFNRSADKDGVGFWLGQRDAGMDLRAISEAFIGSAEFASLYGATLSNAEFVDRLYQNVLHRSADAGGLEFWSQMMGQGLSRADVLVGFSDSPENKAAVAILIGSGFEYTPFG